MTSPVPKPAVPPTDPNADVAALGYEQARDELVTVVARLESGAGSLEDALALWERGEALAARCQQWLDGARERLAAAGAPRPAGPAGATGATGTPGAAGTADERPQQQTTTDDEDGDDE